jgi:hypothetical protein
MIIHFTTRANLWLPSPPPVVQLKTPCFDAGQEDSTGVGGRSSKATVGKRTHRPVGESLRIRIQLYEARVEVFPVFQADYRAVIIASHKRETRERAKLFASASELLNRGRHAHTGVPSTSIDGWPSSTRSRARRENAVCDAPRRLLEPRTTTHGTHPLSVRRSLFPPLPDLQLCWLAARLDGILTRSVGTSGELSQIESLVAVTTDW